MLSKIFEIMACETPVLASVGGEAAEIVRRSGGGSVISPGSAPDIAAEQYLEILATIAGRVRPVVE